MVAQSPSLLAVTRRTHFPRRATQQRAYAYLSRTEDYFRWHLNSYTIFSSLLLRLIRTWNFLTIRINYKDFYESNNPRAGGDSKER